MSSKTQSWLIWFLRGILILGFLVLFGRLADLQIIRGKYFKVLAEENRIRRVPIVAPRGKIYARGGEIIAENKMVMKSIVFNSNSGFEKHESEGNSDEGLITEWVRTYPQGPEFAYITGYLGEVSKEELGKVEAECLSKGPRELGSLMGRGGLEQVYDCILRGSDGEELIEVDALGRKVRTLGRKNPIPGSDLTTSIDFTLQKRIVELLDGKKGAIIVSDARGEILALTSSPTYDPNIFGNKKYSAEIAQVLSDRDLVLFNRAISGTYHPGSVFKPVVAIAALEEGKIDKSYIYDDQGFIALTSVYGNFTFNNWYFTQYGGREGKIGLERAIARSTDTFFYKLGELVGVERIDTWAHKFGLDELTGIDLPGEATGLVPNPIWKMQVKGERWFLGNTYHLAIGQGDLALTPIALNQVISAIANNGDYCSPHIAESESKCKSLGIKEESIELIKNGMLGACSAGGTGYTFFDFKERSGKDVSCKTGTAEVGDGSNDTHAWFTAFAPYADPEIVATVLVERGGEGSRVAGPIAREIFNYWYKVQPSVSPTPTAHDRQ